MVAGDVHAQIMSLAQSCQLLLIVGQPLKDPGLVDLARDLAEVVHARSGAVIYANPEPLRGRGLFDFIDAQLQLSAPDLAAHVSDEAAKVCLSFWWKSMRRANQLIPSSR